MGPCEGVRTADEIWFSRYILYRVAEEFGIGVTLDPKVYSKSGAESSVTMSIFSLSKVTGTVQELI